MQSRKPIPYVLIYIISLIMLGYILYVSVYNQIIAQSDGFFNMIIFAGILLLVFILISLVIKLMAYTPTKDISPVLKYFMIFSALCLLALSAFLRLKYSSSVPVNESVLYKAIDYINEDMLSQGADIAPQLLYYPGEFSYALISSPIFKIFSVEPSFIITVNIINLSIAAIFAFLLASLISDFVCGYLAFILVLFMPGSAFSVYSYGHELFYAALFMITAYLFSLLIFKSFSKPVFSIIISVLAGISGGLLIFTEPLSILFVIALTIWTIVKKKQTLIPMIVTPVLSFVSFLVLCLVKTNMMEEEFSTVFSAFFSSFNPLYNNYKDEAIEFSQFISNVSKYLDDLNSHIVNNYYFLTGKDGQTFSSIQAVWIQLGNQLIFMFLIIMCVSAVLYLLKAKYDKVTPMFSVFAAAFLAQVISSKYSNNGLYFGMLLVVLGSTTIQQMFLNHHPEVSDILVEFEKKDGEIRQIEQAEEIADDKVTDDEVIIKLERARALIFYGENDELYEQIKIEEKQKRFENDVATTMIATGFDEEGNYVSKRETVEYFDDEDAPVENAPHEVKAIPGSRPVEVVKPVFADETGYLDEPDDFDLKSDASLNNDPFVSDDNKLDSVEFSRIPKPSDDGYYFDEDEGVSDNSDSDDDTLYDTADNGAVEDDSTDNEEYVNPNVKEGFIVRKKKRNPSLNPLKSTPIDGDEAGRPETKEEKKQRIKAEKEAAKAEKERAKAEKKLAKSDKKKVDKKNTKTEKDIVKPENEELINENASSEINGNEIKVSNSEKAKKGEHLHNPLPLPKAHVSKDLDFDFEVSDDDDFDY